MMRFLETIIKGNYPFAVTHIEGDNLYITVGKSRFMTNMEGVYPLNRPASRSKFAKKIWEARESANVTLLSMESWKELIDKEEVDYE